MMDRGSGSELCITEGFRGISGRSQICIAGVGGRGRRYGLDRNLDVLVLWSPHCGARLGDCLDVDVLKAMLSPTSETLQECQPALTSQYKTLFLVNSLLFWHLCLLIL